MRIGIDMGGTKIEGIALADTGEELLRKRIDTPRHDYDETVNAIAGIVLYLESETKQFKNWHWITPCICTRLNINIPCFNTGFAGPPISISRLWY